MTRSLRRHVALMRDVAALFPYIRSPRPAIATALGGLALSTLLEGVGIGLLVPVAALILAPADAPAPVAWLRYWLPGSSTSAGVVALALGVALAIAAKNLVVLATARVVARLQRDAMTDLRAALFDRLQRAPLDLYDRTSPGELTALFTVEAERATHAISAALTVVQAAATALLYVGAVVWLSPSLGVAALLLGAVMGLAVAGIFRRVRGASDETFEAESRLATRLSALFTGVRVVRVADAASFERARFDDASRHHAEVRERYERAHAAIPAAVETLAVAASMALVSLAYTAFVATGRVTVVMLSAFCLFLVRLIPLVTRLYGAWGAAEYLAGGSRTVLEWLAVPHFPRRPFGTRDRVELRRGVEITGLSFTHDGRVQSLRPFSLSLPAGSTVAVTGPSGSGKSTLVSLLLRLREPTAGAVTVDGVDFWEFTPAAWSRAVAVVEQDVFLFNDTVAANVAYGLADVERDLITAVLHEAHLGRWLAALPHGLDTMVGERGVALSGGERQRLAIARALLRDPLILLLDEATSQLDAESEREVQAAIARAARGRTVLVAAHGGAVVESADVVVELEPV